MDQNICCSESAIACHTNICRNGHVAEAGVRETAYEDESDTLARSLRLGVPAPAKCVAVFLAIVPAASCFMHHGLR